MDYIDASIKRKTSSTTSSSSNGTTEDEYEINEYKREFFEYCLNANKKFTKIYKLNDCFFQFCIK